MHTLFTLQCDGDTLSAIATPHGPFIVLEPLCESLGLSFSKEYRLLGELGIAGVGPVRLDPDGWAIALDRDALRAWLRVLRGAKAVTYRRELPDTLDEAYAAYVDPRPVPALFAGTIGPRGAAVLLSRLRTIARAFALQLGEEETSSTARRYRAYLERQVRLAVGEMGPPRRFELIPESAYARASAAIDALEDQTARVARVLLA
jgi:hypothetical protein